MHRTLAFVTLVCLTSLVQAENPAPPPTQLCQPIDLVTCEKFDQPAAFGEKGKPGANGWRGGIGQWSIVEGAAYEIQEGPSEKRPHGHEAVCEYVTDLGDLVLRGEFRLGDSPQVGFVCRDTNQPNHHLGRVVITPQAIWIQKMSGIAKETRKEELTRIKVDIDPTAWHTIAIEVCGDRWIARIDQHMIAAQHQRFQDRKGRVGMVARGEGAQFRNLAVWKATAKKKPSAE
ncbi:family 16 glycoside hydrolase [Blastopirellula marina]|uniref:3-keto-alpha-glucoside-1,2-lyase/3-keto-2-hydroxy-glucal hydratase domain-containing protein n=1 Tax=Blastopirellula marina DSM 3645 TaxID=314230 RepID=A3ZPH3_9BACT|nr:family 16 glycoside hydrolase [Blastopirellula marina]EAQ81651.1 hypothetical protein DSM3645_28757 [Blastopirellula marina DSM 3645]